MDLVVSPGDCTLTALTLANCVQESRDSTAVLLDLTHAKFLDPAALVAVAAVAERAERDGQSVEFRDPVDADCANYLSRMHLGHALDLAGVDHGLRAVSERDVGDRLRELRRFRSEEGIEEVTQTIMRLLDASGDGATAPEIYESVFEIGVNAVQHSGREGGFLALQTFPKLHEVAFAIADSGKGLRSSLNENPRNVGMIPDDCAAVRQAAQKHVSGIDQPGRGRGISTVIAAATERPAGRVLLVSGDAVGTFHRGEPGPRVSLLQDPFLGTLVQARLSM